MSATGTSSGVTYLCVGLQRDEASVQRGQTAQWNVSVWATGQQVDKVVLSLATSPSSQKPKFSRNGKASWTLGTVYPKAQPTQLQAQVPIAATATSVTSVKLTVTGNGQNVATPPPRASVPIAVTAPAASASPSRRSTSRPASAASSASGAASAPGAASPSLHTAPPPTSATSPLPVGGLPYLSGSGSPASLNPGGNASSLFPTLNPSAGSTSGHTVPRTRPVADTLPGDMSVMGAQYAGLGALALALVLSVTRRSIRRRRAAAQNSSGSN